MGKNQLRLLAFALHYPGWHTCGPDSRPAMRALEGKGLLEVAEYGRKAPPQFRINLPAWAHDGINAKRDSKDDSDFAKTVLPNQDSL